MDSKYIEQLLERYWQCETSLEDEAELRAFFSGSDVPKHLLRYKDLFVYQQLQQEVHLGEDFDARVLAEVEVPVVKAKRMTLTARFMMKVTCESELVKVDGRALTFSVKAFDEAGLIGEGTHERFIVFEEKFQKKADDKAK